MKPTASLPPSSASSHATVNSSRRVFCRAVASGLLALPMIQGIPLGSGPQAYGIEPFARLTPGRLQLSLAAYSLRDLLKAQGSGWDLFRFVDYCHELGIPGAELTSYYFPAEVTNDYLLRLKRHCHLRGVTVSGGAIANDFCQLDPQKVRADIEATKRWIDRYAVLGAPVIRIFAGGQPAGEAWPETRERCVQAIEEVADHAAAKGLYLGLENHGGVTATSESMLEIVTRVRSNGFGVNLDSGNFRSTADPYRELSEIAPYAVNAQLKVEMFPNDQREWTDLPRVLRILVDSGYSGWVALEYEAEDPPLESIPAWVEKLKSYLRELPG